MPIGGYFLGDPDEQQNYEGFHEPNVLCVYNGYKMTDKSDIKIMLNENEFIILSCEIDPPIKNFFIPYLDQLFILFIIAAAFYLARFVKHKIKA